MLNPSLNATASRSGSLRLAGHSDSRRARRIAADHRSLCSAKDIRLVQEWLAIHAPIADVITVVEVRHRFEFAPIDCRAYAIEIVRAAKSLSRSESEPNPNLKEFHHAAA
jgi:hypothetical protein